MKIQNRKILTQLKTRLLKDKLVILNGARQTGKTTLCQKILPKILKKSIFYVSFDDPEERIRFKDQGIMILENIKEEIIILDEVQKIPEILDCVKFVFDQEKTKKKRKLFILTGSCQLTLLKRVKETLAGRASILNLYPFSLNELNKNSNYNFLSKVISSPFNIKDFKKNELILKTSLKRKIINIKNNILFWGGYPPVYEKKEKIDKINWLKNYQNTYLERDIFDIGQVEKIDTFARVQKMLATRTAQLFSLSEISKELGLAVNTVKRYIYLLEISFQCFLLRPYFNNATKRLVKTPKIYFSDNGLLKTILGNLTINSGHIYENWIFSEIIKWKELQTIKPEIYFYQTSSKLEVDFIICQEDKILPLEVKQAKKIKESFSKSIRKFKKDYSQVKLGIVCYQGDKIEEIEKNIWAVPDWMIFS